MRSGEKQEISAVWSKILSEVQFLKQENGSKYLYFSSNMYHLDKALMSFIEIEFFYRGHAL